MGIITGMREGFGALGKVDLSPEAVPGLCQQSKCATVTRLVSVIILGLVSLSALALGLLSCATTTIGGIVGGVSVIALALLGLVWAAVVLKRLCTSRAEEKPEEVKMEGLNVKTNAELQKSERSNSIGSDA